MTAPAGPRRGSPAEKGVLEQTAPSPWRVWVSNQHRIVSFHPEEGFRLLEFQSRELFLACLDRYTGERYRYM